MNKSPEELDVELHECELTGGTIVLSEHGGTMFATEDEACTFQRHWRELHGLDPITGEEVRELSFLCGE